jgi:alkylated DNA repair dioxygenase AlkB
MWQTTLLGGQRPQLQDLDLLERIHLDHQSWLDLGRDMIHGSDELFAAVHDRLPWQSLERPMYDRIVSVPRLTSVLPADDHRFPPVLGSMIEALSARYGLEFDHIGANLYRSGADSVAWHSDRIGRRISHPVIAVISLGGSRVFRLRPRGGGPGRSIPLHSGDVLVMGGGCQHRWEHCVPKIRHAQPRISLTIRHDGGFEADDPDWVLSV